MNKNSVIITLVIMLVCIFLTGCQEHGNQNGDQQYPENIFIGTWEIINSAFYYETWTFHANSTAKNFLIQEYEGEKINATYWFNYTTDNTTLCFSTNGSPDSSSYFSICYSYLFSENATRLAFLYNDIVIMNLMKL